MANAKDHISVDISSALELFDELAVNEQDKIVIAGIRSAGKTILDKAKSNFQARTKGQSTNDYPFNSKFKIAKLSKRTDNFGVKLGIINDYGGYRMRWVEWGTEDREYKARKSFKLKEHFIRKGTIVNTGKIQATHFFYDAVEETYDDASKKISENIIKSYNRTIARLNKTK